MTENEVRSVVISVLDEFLSEADKAYAEWGGTPAMCLKWALEAVARRQADGDA